MNRRGWLLGALVALSPAVSQAAALMLVDGVVGPSKTAGYAGWFNLEAYNWSIDRSKTPEPHTFNVVLVVSAAAATLIQASASGALPKKIVVDQLESVDGGFLLNGRLTCEEPAIRASATAGDPDDRARLNLKIQCGRLAWEYFDYNSTSKALVASGKGSWNFKTNTP